MRCKNSQKPNVVFILADDLGEWAMGCSGNQEIYTPNLNRIAKEGMRWTNFFCASPVCSPARASLLTGRIPSQHGVHDWIREGNNGEEPIEYLEGQRSYTEVLVEHGYISGLSGKWHLGHSLKPQKGHVDWYAHQEGGGPYYHAPMIRDGSEYTEPRYVTDAITEEAITMLESYAKGSKPFYLGIHYTAPHSPWGREQHPDSIWRMYEDCLFDSVPELPVHTWQINSAPFGEGEKRRELLRGYYTAVTAMDQGIGSILDRLEELGLHENTLVVFTSDNGMNMGHHGIWGKGNGTFPQNMFDTSVKVPFIASHPGRIPQGRVCDELVSAYDFMPTLLDYLGIDFPPSVQLPGVSFASLLNGGSANQERSVVVCDEYGPVRMLRTRDWKYVHRYPYGPNELFHLASDPDEQRNRIDAPHDQEIIEHMRRMLEDWFNQYVHPEIDGARMPVTGKGQLSWVGPKAKGKQAFADLDEQLEKHGKL